MRPDGFLPLLYASSSAFNVQLVSGDNDIVQPLCVQKNQ